MDQNKKKLLVFYTRKEETHYPFELARSVHMAMVLQERSCVQ